MTTGLKTHGGLLGRAYELQAPCRIMENACVTDQLNCPALQSMDLVMRRIEVLQDAQARSPSRPDYSAADIRMGWAYRHVGRDIDPGLQSLTAGQLRDQAAMTKEAQKARKEAEAAAKAPAKQKGEGKGAAADADDG